ncbi:hypothetical protein HanXRQr2_Chr04g0147411 [Helianthus annuus]|uniref:Uncharacterized protein n=1 Tax=Helianthus annuus TaxID=4232 RepID=A0A9K3NQ75_HELAN|nr:hypothetical protein HanXRQr2_Chr04g0147411 [Helianthus annuus]
MRRDGACRRTHIIPSQQESQESELRSIYSPLGAMCYTSTN